jgi:4-oxalocrotonate tautomerase
MPVINVQIAKGRSEETKQELVKKLSEVACDVLNVERDWVTILITEYERENWATGGILHSIKFAEVGGNGKNKE